MSGTQMLANNGCINETRSEAPMLIWSSECGSRAFGSRPVHGQLKLANVNFGQDRIARQEIRVHTSEFAFGRGVEHESDDTKSQTCSTQMRCRRSYLMDVVIGHC